MFDVFSIILGIASFILSLISILSAKNAKKIAFEAKENVTTLIKGKQKTSLIQKLLEACSSVRDVSFQYRNKTIPKRREEDIEKNINILNDYKYIVKNTEIETQINELPEHVKNLNVLHDAIGVLISKLNAYKYENDFNT